MLFLHQKQFGIDLETIFSLNCQTLLQFDINHKMSLSENSST